MSPMSKFKEHFFFNHNSISNNSSSSSRRRYDSNLALTLQRYSIGSINVDENGCIFTQDDVCYHPMEEVNLSPVSMMSSSSSSSSFVSSSSHYCNSPPSFPATTTTHHDGSLPSSSTSSFKSRFRSFCHLDGSDKKPLNGNC